MEATQVAISLSHKRLSEPELQVSQPELQVVRLEGGQSNISCRVRVVAGLALALTSGAIAQNVHQAPQYEGKFELAAAPVNAARSLPSPQIQDVNQTIPVSALNSDQIQVLKSPMLVEPIVERLKAQIPNLDYAAVKESLQITANDPQHLEVSYRDANPQTVHLVLEQLAKAYVEYSQQCQSDRCRGIAFIETQIPQVQQQVQQRRTEIEQLYRQNGIKNLDAQMGLVTARTTEVAKQKAEVNGKILQANQQYTELQSRMALQPNEAIAANILSQNPRYQGLLSQLQVVDQKLAIEFKQLDVRNPRLEALNAQHQTLLSQLNQEARQALQRYLSNPGANLQNPIFQDKASLNLLQQSVVTVNYLQVLKTTQQRLVQMEGVLKQQRSQLTKVLYQYAQLRQELDAKTQSLQQYIDQLKALKAQSSQQTALKITSPPEMLEDSTGKITSIEADDQNYAGAIAALGILLGVGAIVGPNLVGSVAKRVGLQKVRQVTG